MDKKVVREYNIVIPCPIHKNKAIEYLCTHPTPHTRNLFCTTCIFKKDCCEHEEDIQDLSEFLNEQRQQFRRHGLHTAPEISEALDSKDDFLENCTDQAQQQVEFIEHHFDLLTHKVVQSLNQAKEEAIKALEGYIEYFTKTYKTLEMKVRMNFQKQFFSAKFKSFEEMIKNFMPFTYENIGMMINALRENYTTQKNVSNDIIFSYEQVMAFQRDTPMFDVNKFEALQNQLYAFMNELKMVTPNLISTTYKNSEGPSNGDSLSSSRQYTPIVKKRSSSQIRVIQDIPKALRESLGKIRTNSSFADQIADSEVESKRSKSTMRITNRHLTGINLPVIVKDLRAAHKNNEKAYLPFERQIRHLKSFDSGHTRTIFSILYLGGSLLASASDDGLIKIWNIDKNKCLNVLRGHTSGVRALALLDSKNLVSASWDRTIKIWSTSSLIHKGIIENASLEQPNNSDSEADLLEIHCLKTLKGHTNSVLCLGVLPDGKTIMSGSSDNSIKLWNSESGIALRTMFAHMNEVECLVAAQQRPYIISGSGDKTIKVWNYNTKKSSSPCLRTLEGHTGFVWSLALLHDDSTLVSGSQDNVIRVWNIDTGDCMKILVGHSSQVLTLKLFRNNVLMSGDSEGIIKLWNLENSCLLASLKGTADKSAINSLDVNEDNILIAAGADKKISFWA